MADSRFVTISRPARHKRVVLFPDVIVKHDTTDRIRLEVLKTTIAANVARRTSLFRVPTIVSHDIESGLITFERLSEVRPLREVLNTGKNPEQIMRRLGVALASIHATVIPADLPLVAPVPCGLNNSPVFVHGDFGIDNILYDGPRDELVIIDWSVSDWLAMTDGAGPCYLDLSMMVKSLLVRRMLAPGCIRRANVLARSFMRGYVSNSTHARSSDEFKRYFEALLWTYMKARWRVITFPAFLARCPSFARAWVAVRRMNLS